MNVEDLVAIVEGATSELVKALKARDEEIRRLNADRIAAVLEQIASK